MNYFQKLLASNTTNALAPSFSVTSTRPSTPVTTPSYGVIAPKSKGIDLVVFGTDDANETGTLTVHRWYTAMSGDTLFYIPTLAGIFSATLSTKTGIEMGIITDSEFIADGISLSSNNGDDRFKDSGNDQNEPAYLYIQTLDSALISVHFAIGTAANLNALWRDSAWLMGSR